MLRSACRYRSSPGLGSKKLWKSIKGNGLPQKGLGGNDRSGDEEADEKADRRPDGGKPETDFDFSVDLLF